MTNPVAREQMLGIAEEYEHLAQRERAARYRERAEQHRCMAQNATSSDARHRSIQLAREYEELAERLELKI